MLIHGHPVSPPLLRHPAEDGRFWYWRGASGQRYIHSVYPAGACPPLPGAIYVAVHRTGSLRTALAAGRFSVFWDLVAEAQVAAVMAAIGANEVHVHLLAGNEERTRAILADLEAAMVPAGDVSRSAPASGYAVGFAA